MRRRGGRRKAGEEQDEVGREAIGEGGTERVGEAAEPWEEMEEDKEEED